MYKIESKYLSNDPYIGNNKYQFNIAVGNPYAKTSVAFLASVNEDKLAINTEIIANG